MAIPVARVHLKVAHAALPALLPTPPRSMMLPLLPTPPCVAASAILPKPLARPGRAGANERWDARNTKPASAEAEPSASSSSGPRSADSVIWSSAGRGSPRKNATLPPAKPGRADAVERWDAHKNAASPASSSSSSGTRSLASSSKWPICPASSTERWDVHKKRCPSQAELLDDGENSSTGSNDIDDTEEEEGEEILWKPRVMCAGPDFAAASLFSSMLPMPTAFLVPVA